MRPSHTDIEISITVLCQQSGTDTRPEQGSPSRCDIDSLSGPACCTMSAGGGARRVRVAVRTRPTAQFAHDQIKLQDDGKVNRCMMNGRNYPYTLRVWSSMF